MKIVKLSCLAFVGILLICCNGIGPNADKPNAKGDLIIKCGSLTPLGTIDSLVPGVRVKTIAAFNGYRYLLYKTDGSEPLEKTILRLCKNRNIASVEKENVYKHFLVPNDPAYGYFQYSAGITDCETAWNTYTGSPSITVAVIDTGVNGQHEDLGAGKVTAGFNFVDGVDITAGMNSDDYGHGTHVSGIIGAVGNNGKGVAGVSWNTAIMPVKVLDATGSGVTSAITAGIIWAVDNGANVINMSLGGTGYSQAMADAVDYALTNGVVVVCAMGNDGSFVKEFPASYSGVIAVGSTNGRDQLSGFSTRGSLISVAAPGENIYSLSNLANDGYLFMSGTSMAAPFVSGVASLLLANNPSLTPAEVRSIIEDSAQDLGSPGFDPQFGYGRVNVNAALNLTARDNYGKITASVSFNGAPVDGVGILLMNETGTETLQAALTGLGDTGGTLGEAVFSMVHSGNYLVSVYYNGVTQKTPVVLSGDGDVPVNFPFTGVAPMNYVIETFPNGGGDTADTYMELYDGNQALIDWNDDIDYPANAYSRIVHALSTGQTYYVKIMDTYYSPGYYSILVSQTGGGSSTATPSTDVGEPDDTSAQAQALSVDVVHDDYLSSGEIDWYMITIPQ
jgi:subtilisin family serine protease